MPSGAKKRKSAKKKSENQSNNDPTPSSASTQTHGDGADKDSDVGEVNSPVSQDLHSHHTNNSVGEDEIGEKSDVIDEPRKIAVENKSEKKDGKFEDDEIASKSYYDGGSSGSSSSNSSSDDESHENKNSKDENVPVVVQMDISLEEAIIPSVKNNIAAISYTTECVAQEDDQRLSLSYNAPIASGDNERDSEASEPLLAPGRHPEQKTSWKSCCGLFEVFTVSGR